MSIHHNMDVDAVPSMPPRALAVDHHAATRAEHRRLLTHCGLAAEVASDAMDAVRAVSAARATNLPYDLILLDVDMPFDGGWTAASTFRRDGYKSRLIAIGSSPDATTPTLCAINAVDYFLLKPMAVNVLIATIKACITVSRDPAPTAGNGPAGDAFAN